MQITPFGLEVALLTQLEQAHRCHHEAPPCHDAPDRFTPSEALQQTGPCPASDRTPGPMQMPSQHLVAFNAPGSYHEHSSTTPGPDGKIHQDTTYTSDNGQVCFTDNSTYDPSSGVMISQQTDGGNRSCTVQTTVQGNQIVSNVVGGQADVKGAVINFNGDGTNTLTYSQNDGTTTTYHDTNSSGPWQTVSPSSSDALESSTTTGNTITWSSIPGSGYTSTLV